MVIKNFDRVLSWRIRDSGRGIKVRIMEARINKRMKEGTREEIFKSFFPDCLPS